MSGHNKSHEKWGFLKNPFHIYTQDSYKRFLTLSTDHLDKLQAAETAELMRLQGRYAPLHEHFKAKYENLANQRAFFGAATYQVDNLQQELAKVIKKWNIRIQTVFFEDTPEYQVIFPKKKKPFQTGGREQRLSALSALIERLKVYPELEEVRLDVTTFYNNFLLLRQKQQQHEQKVQWASEQLKTAHQTASAMLYRNLGALMDLYGNDYKVVSFFDIGLLRNGLSGKGKMQVDGENGTGEMEEGDQEEEDGQKDKAA